MTDQWITIKIRRSVLDSIRYECKKLYLKSHPENEGMKITDNWMITQITKFYLEAP